MLGWDSRSWRGNLLARTFVKLSRVYLSLNTASWPHGIDYLQYNYHSLSYYSKWHNFTNDDNFVISSTPLWGVFEVNKFFLLLEELFLNICQKGLQVTNSLSFCLSDKVFISHSLLNENFTGYIQSFCWCFFLSHHLKYFTSFLSFKVSEGSQM